MSFLIDIGYLTYFFFYIHTQSPQHFMTEVYASYIYEFWKVGRRNSPECVEQQGS